MAFNEVYLPTVYETTAGLTITTPGLYFPPGNIRRYGADPTDTTDSWSAFWSSWLQFRLGGAALHIPSGVYQVSRSLQFYPIATTVSTEAFGQSVIITGEGTVNSVVDFRGSGKLFDCGATPAGRSHTSNSITNILVNPIEQGWQVGWGISGSGVPAGTTITGMTSSSLTLSQATTSTLNPFQFTVTKSDGSLFTAAWGNGLSMSKFRIVTNDSKVSAIGIELKTQYNGIIDQVAIQGLSSHAINCPETSGDIDANTWFTISNCELLDCGGWGINLYPSSGFNQNGFFKIESNWIQNCGTIMPTSSITAITAANPAVVTTATPHGFENTQYVYIYGVNGALWANSVFLVAGATTNTFQLSGVDSTTLAAYVNGGAVRARIPTSGGMGIASDTIQIINNGLTINSNCAIAIGRGDSTNPPTGDSTGARGVILESNDFENNGPIQIDVQNVAVLRAVNGNEVLNGASFEVGASHGVFIDSATSNSFNEVFDGLFVRKNPCQNILPSAFVTNVTNANPAVVTTSFAHGLTNGQPVSIRNASTKTGQGNFWLNSDWYAANVTTTTFSLQLTPGVDYNSTSSVPYIRNGVIFNRIAITGITNANPAVVTTGTSHGIQNGQYVLIQNVQGATWANDIYLVAGRTATTFQLSGKNSSALATYISGGRVSIVRPNTTYQLAGGNANTQTIRVTNTEWNVGDYVYQDRFIGPFIFNPVFNGMYLTWTSNTALTLMPFTNNSLPIRLRGPAGNGAPANGIVASTNGEWVTRVVASLTGTISGSVANTRYYVYAQETSNGSFGLIYSTTAYVVDNTSGYKIKTDDPTAYFLGCWATNPGNANLSATKIVLGLDPGASDGARDFVTDATSTTNGAAATGGGANAVSVVRIGGAWVIG